MNDIYKRKTIRVPVKYVNGNWECFYGGPVPVRDGTIGDLIVDEHAVEEKNVIEMLKKKSRHKILDTGSELLVALTIKPKPEIDKKLTDNLLKSNSQDIRLDATYYHILRSPDTRFVKVTIGDPTDSQKAKDKNAEGGIWIDLQGLQPKGITTSSINLPAGVSADPAISLNHAFTILSELYEPWRKSHTGNIYSRMLYKEKNNRWYPIEVLRNTAIIKDEHELIKSQWKIIAAKLNINQI